MKNLISHLLGDTRSAILTVLLLRPDEPKHVRELARLTKVSPGTLHRDLTALESLGVLHRNAVGRQVFFSANRECPVFEELAGLVRKTAGPEAARSGARAGAEKAAMSVSEKLRISQTRLEALCIKFGVAKLSLFGSASRGELTRGSDVNLMVEFSPDHHAAPLDTRTMQDEFSTAFGGRKVAIVTAEILLNPTRRDAIVAELKLLFQA